MKTKATFTTEQQIDELKMELKKAFHITIPASCSKEEHIKELCVLFDHLQSIYHS